MRPNKALLTYDATAVEASLAPLTRRALHELAGEGIVPTIAEVCWLNRFALQLQGKFRKELAKGVPHLIGDRWFWPRTLCARYWLAWFMAEVGDAQLALAAMCYSMENARSGEAFERLYDVGEAMKEMHRYSKSLALTESEVGLVLEMMAGDEPREKNEDDQDAARSDEARVVALLCQNFGGTPEYWKTREDEDSIVDYMRVLSDQHSAGRGRTVSRMSNAEMDCQRRYDYAVQCLRVKYIGAEKAGYAEVFANG